MGKKQREKEIIIYKFIKIISVISKRVLKGGGGGGRLRSAAHCPRSLR
jgi:hypothetical protein